MVFYFIYPYLFILKINVFTCEKKIVVPVQLCVLSTGFAQISPQVNAVCSSFPSLFPNQIKESDTLENCGAISDDDDCDDDCGCECHCECTCEPRGSHHHHNNGCNDNCCDDDYDDCGCNDYNSCRPHRPNRPQPRR
ncbi:MAG: hypothetical protein ACK5MV_14135 [Aminipila sp.]